jgi:hypothetical protein
MKQPFTRQQRTTMIYAILCWVLFIVVMQLWLLAATMNAYLGGDDSVIWPAALVSLVCFALNFGLLRYLKVLEKPSEPKVQATVKTYVAYASGSDSKPPSTR